MRILYVQRHYMHYRKLLIEYLEASTGYKITVIDTNTTKDSFSDGYISLKSKIRKINIFGKSYEVNISTGIAKYIRSNREKYDLIILEGVSNIINNFIFYFILKFYKVPYIVWDAGRRLGAEMTPARKLVQPFVKMLFKSASACIAYSTVAKEYIRTLGVREDKIFVCQNTLNVSHFDSQIESIAISEIEALKRKHGMENKKIILYVGGLEKRKRVDDLILAFKLLNREDLGLIIVGDGPDKEKLADLCSSQGIKNVVFTGQVIDGVIIYFLSCDLFVLPSEGGLALNQAMICQKPVIASSADGTERDLIENGENGFIFSEGSIEELKDSIERVFTLGPAIMGRTSRLIIESTANERVFKENFVAAVESVKPE